MQYYTVADTLAPPVVNPGQVITDTLTITNPAKVGYSTASASVDLSGVLDDATLLATVASAGTTNLSGSTLTWSGPLGIAPSPAATVTVTITFRVADPDTGDHLIGVVGGAGQPGWNLRDAHRLQRE